MSKIGNRKNFIAPDPRLAQQYMRSQNELYDWEQSFSTLVEEKDAIEKEHVQILSEMQALEQKRVAIVKRAEENESRRMQMKILREEMTARHAHHRTKIAQTITSKNSNSTPNLFQLQ